MSSLFEWITLKGDKMSSKNKLIGVGVGLYVVGCVAIGIFAGKFLYDYIHAPGQPFSWLKAGLAIYAGLFVIGILGIPTRRYTLPKCPECKSGRLHRREETIGTFHRRGGAGKLYYGIRSMTECATIKETMSCDRCDYKSVREYVREGAVTIH